MIRKFVSGDLESVMSIWLKSNIESHDFIDRSYWESNYEIVKEMLAESTIYVYEDYGKIKAFVGLENTYIAGIFVNSDDRSIGIGSLLIKYLKEIYSELSLKVYTKNKRAVEFYSKHEFLITNKDFDDNGEKEYLMEWRK